MHKEARDWYQVSLLSLSPLLLDIGSVIKSQTHQLVIRLQVSSEGWHVSHAYVFNLSISLRMCTATFSFYVDSWDPNLGSQGCAAGTLPPESSPQPSSYISQTLDSQSQEQWRSLGDAEMPESRPHAACPLSRLCLWQVLEDLISQGKPWS